MTSGKKIVELRQAGQGYKTISKTPGMARGTVQSILVKYKRMGVVQKLARTGRPPRRVSPGLRKRIIRDVRNNPRKSSREVKVELPDVGMEVSRRASQEEVGRTLHEAGSKACGPRKAPLLKPRPLAARFKFAWDSLNLSRFSFPMIHVRTVYSSEQPVVLWHTVTASSPDKRDLDLGTAL